MAAANNVFGEVQNAVSRAGYHAEGAVCDVWEATLPPPIKAFLTASQTGFWRNIQRGLSFTAASALPFAVMPFTLPLLLFFYPLLIWFETARLSFAVVANCGRVSTTMKNEATDLLMLLDLFAPGTPMGMVARGVLQAVGAGVVVTIYDAIADPARAVLLPMVEGRNVRASDVATFAIAVGRVAGDESIMDWMRIADTAADEVEAAIIAGLDEVNALSPAARSSTPTVTAELSFTRPEVAAAIIENQKAQQAEKGADAAVVVGVAASALGIAAALKSLSK